MKKLILAISIAAIAMSCTKSDPVRDALLEKAGNLATVSDIQYDADYSTSTVLGLFWDNEAALDCGASSFSIVVSEEMFEFTDESGASNALTYTVKSSDVPNNAIMIADRDGLVSGTAYYVKIAAVYPGPSKSAYVYLLGEDGQPAKVIAGKGIQE